MDERAVERAVDRFRLRFPRAAMVGRAGPLSGSQVGSSLELHDFREYQPGDDPRHLDWNAVARTGKLVLRVRREEVAPRVEILVDGSASMAVSAAKQERVRELCALFAGAARAGGVIPTVLWLSDAPRRVEGPPPADFAARLPLPSILRRTRLRPCGVRLLIGDLLFEGPPRSAIERLADGAGLLGLVQVLDAFDEDPESSAGARLVDSETGEALDRVLSPRAVERYRARFAAHQAGIQAEARRVRAVHARVSAAAPLEAAIRERLAGRLLVPRGMGPG